MTEGTETAGAALRVSLPGNPDIVAPARSHVVIVGPSGSGKSAFCRILAGVSDDSVLETGIVLGGRPLVGLSPAERSRLISLVPSDPYLAFAGTKRSLGGELELILRLVCLPGPEVQDFLREVTARLGLDSLLTRDPFTLSGGEAVRAAVAMALLKRPELLVMDQMHEQLDPDALPRVHESIAALLPQSSVLVETRCRQPWQATGDLPSGWQRDGTHPWILRVYSLYKEPPEHNSTAGMAGPAVAGTGSEAASSRVDVEGFCHAYPSSGFRLGPIDFHAQAGDRIALVGPNGSGKSTFLKGLALLERPKFERLEITCRNGAVSTPPPERDTHLWARTALYCFQRPENQLYLATVEDELKETASRLGGPGTLQEALLIARQIGLEPYLGQSPYDLPRSFRRLIPMAGALAVDPPLLMLDEPTVSLDDAQVHCLSEIITARRGTGVTLFISHDEAFISSTATRRIDIREMKGYQGAFLKPA
jgi:energy-coupling factor transporter ATP-binding protein EcfA2